MMEKKKSNVFINTLVLLIVTLVCVALLAVVNQVTRTPIQQAEINARAETYKVVYPNANSFAEVEDKQALLDEAPENLSASGYDGCYINDVLSVTTADGAVEGYVIAATSPNGYGGDIQIAVGITADGEITGFNPISHSETPGFGAKCEEDDFKSQFEGMPATILEYSKTGATQDNQIDAISGATRTTNAITEAVNSAVLFYQSSLINE